MYINILYNINLWHKIKIMGNKTFTKITYLRDAVLYVEAKGRLDIYNAEDYFNEIMEHLKYIKELVLDFSKITYSTSIGLRVILKLQQIMDNNDCQMTLKNVNEDILHAFQITGFDKFLNIENDSDFNPSTDNESGNEDTDNNKNS